jgi:vacuolar-type H+-ATPase subunit D/Vma8
LQLLKRQTDSLETQIKNKKDSINLLNNYIIFLENETQFLGSVLAEKELEDGIE